MLELECVYECIHCLFFFLCALCFYKLLILFLKHEDSDVLNHKSEGYPLYQFASPVSKSAFSVQIASVLETGCKKAGK